MTREEALEKLEVLNMAITTAVHLIASEQETLDRFFVESARMDSVGPILHPTLFNNSERQATEALLKPVYEAARNLVTVYNERLARANQALRRVKS